MAKKLLSQPATSASCERNFSLFGRVQSSRRRRLGYKQLEDLVYCNANLKLMDGRLARARRTMRLPTTEKETEWDPFGLGREYNPDSVWGAHGTDGYNRAGVPKDSAFEMEMEGLGQVPEEEDEDMCDEYEFDQPMDGM